MSAPAFRRRTAAVLAAVCAVSLVGLGLLFVFGPELRPTRSAQADSYSISAIGHAALHDLLEARDVPVAVHRRPGDDPLPGGGVLLLLEPALRFVGGEAGRIALRDLVSSAPAVLLALPKWRVPSDPSAEEHARSVYPVSLDEAAGPLRALGVEAQVLRPRAGATFPPDAQGRRPTWEQAYRQTLRSDAVEPLITGEAGMLLGRIAGWPGAEIYVLADPDVLSNHGLHRGENAALVLSWIDTLRRGGPVVFDETLHGFPPIDESVLREAFRFPLVLVLAHLLLLTALLLWAGLGRFGDAPPPKPALEPGSGFLIHQTAALLRFGGHQDMALRRYVRDTAHDVAARFHLPAALRGADLDARLDALGRRRGVRRTWSEVRAGALAAQVGGRGRGEGAVLRAARDVHAWKREMLHGARSDPRDA